MTKRRYNTEESLSHSPQQPWLTVGMLEALAELNEQCLELLIEQAGVGAPASGQPLLSELASLWSELDPPARQRAASCPFLLADAGFADLRRWSATRVNQVQDHESPRRFFTVPRAAQTSHLVLTYAWDLARTQGSAARLLLGMPAACADLIAACSVKQIADIAARRPEWLQPRWPGRIRFWEELLVAAISNDTATLELTRMRGVQLLASETRLAMGT